MADEAMVLFMSHDGNLMRHECTQDLGHTGNHTCGCGYQWPRQNLPFEPWHIAHPPGGHELLVQSRLIPAEG